MTKFTKHGLPFVPQGSNYIAEPGGTVRTFDVGHYDATATDDALRAMQGRQYNAVRLFAWLPSAGGTSANTLSDAYVANLADAIKKAYARGIYVILSCGGLPSTYFPTSFDPGYSYTTQWLYLTTQGLTARNLVMHDLLIALNNHGVIADMYLALEVTGELSFTFADYPSNRWAAHGGPGTGTITTATGVYDASVATDCNKMLDDGIVHFITQHTTYLHGLATGVPVMVQLAPTAYGQNLSIAYFPNAAVLNNGTMDAIGLSLYPTYDVPLASVISSLGASLPQSKILTTLETGWFASHTGTIAALAQQSVTWQQASCGYGVYGSLFFTWDTPHADTLASTGTAYYNMNETDSSGASFADALSPTQIGDGCGAGNAALAPVLAGRMLRAHFYAPGQYAETNNLPAAIVREVTAWQVTMTQVNRFDGHRLEVAEANRNILLALPPFTTVDIEQVGLGVIARGIITAPEQQIDTSYVGKVILEIPNITDQGVEISTGMGYVDSNAIKDVVSNLGNLTTKSVSILTGYDGQGLAQTTRVAGQPTGWSAAYVNDGTYISASQPVSWAGLANATNNGNSVTRAPGGATSYTTYPSGASGTSGGSGLPIHTDVTRPAQLQWQMVIPCVAQVGLRSDAAINNPDFGFDFSNPRTAGDGTLQGTWQIIYNRSGSGQPSGTYDGNTTFAVALTIISGAPYIQYLVGGLPQGAPAPLVGNGPFVPIAWIATPSGEVDNLIMTRTVPASEAWYQVRYDKRTQVDALLQLASDTGMFVRQAADATGAPQRGYEFGPMNAAATVRLVDGRGGDINRLRANANVRLIGEITSYKRDVSGCYTVSTPLGAGTGAAQVTIELLWRILNDTTYENYYAKYGNIANIFPEYDPTFQIYRDGDNGTYEYFISYEPAFAPYTGYLNWLQAGGAALYPSSLGFKEGGPAADSQIAYPDDAATTAQREGAQRLLYKKWIEEMKRAVVPHVTITLTTVGDWRPPKAGDKVRIDYTQTIADKLGPWAPLHILTGTSADNPDPRVMSVVRAADGDGMAIDTWTLSNLGRYEDDGTAIIAGLLSTQHAIQVTTQNAPCVWTLAPTKYNLDAAHPVLYPIKNLPTMFRMTAAFIRVDFAYYQQPVTTADNSDGTIIYSSFSGASVIIPTPTQLDTQNANIGDVPKHIHQMEVFGDVPGAPTSSSKWVSLDAFGTGDPTSLSVHNGSDSKIYTEGPITKVDVTPTAHPHNVKSAGQTIGTIVPGTALGNLPQHTHPITPDLTDLTLPTEITVDIDSGDGVFVPRSAQLATVTGSSTSGSGPWTATFEMECSRFLSFPGRTVWLRFNSVDNANKGRGAIIISGTIAAEFGGLGSVVQATQ